MGFKKTKKVANPFAKALGNHKEAFDEQKKVKGGGGDHTALAELLGLKKKGQTTLVMAKHVKSECGATDEGNAFVRHTFQISRGDAEGHAVTSYMVVKDYSEKFTTNDVIRNICQEFQALGYETEDISAEDIEEICEDLSKSNPEVQLKLRYSGEWVNANVKKLLSSEEDSEEEESEEEETQDDIAEESSEEEESEEESSEEEESEDSEDSSEEEEESEEEDAAPEKGNVVFLDADKKKTQYVVKAVNSKKRTVDLVDLKTKKIEKKVISWDDISFVDED